MEAFFNREEFGTVMTKMISKDFNSRKMEHCGVEAIFGISAGYASKKLLKITAGGLGLIFIGLQTLQNIDVIEIKWKTISRIALEKFDMDGDGQISINDFRLGMNSSVKHLSKDIPGSMSFISAFWTGFRFG